MLNLDNYTELNARLSWNLIGVRGISKAQLKGKVGTALCRFSL